MSLADVMRLASETLLVCRHDGCITEADGSPVEVRPRLRRLREELARLDPGAPGELPRDGERMLTVLRVGAAELERLSEAGMTGAVRSLGYALHVLPDLLNGGEGFSRRRFLFNLRIAAFHWAALVPEMRQALCELMRLDPDVVARQIERPGFCIDMYRDRT